MPVVNNIIIVDPMIISRAQSSFNLIIYQICDQCLGPEDQFFFLIILFFCQNEGSPINVSLDAKRLAV